MCVVVFVNKGSACDECSVCPRVCSYSDQECYVQFEIPEVNKTDIFIDEFEVIYIFLHWTYKVLLCCVELLQV